MIITSNPTHSSFSRVSDVLNGEALSDTLGKLDSAPRAQGLPHIRGIPLLRGVSCTRNFALRSAGGPCARGAESNYPTVIN